ncbi:MAG: DUF3883 domain-containing protein [Candidatus Thorarchaeota archaeon]|nr:DUF3883 domain-containing protein [Candidatus Thorarchaeota archaeon]
MEILTYDGISSLQPYYIGTQSGISFLSPVDHMEKWKNEWFEKQYRLWKSKKKDTELQVLESENEAKRESKRIMLKEHLERRPRDVRVEQVKTICPVEFEKTESEQAWLERHEVEELAMAAAMSCHDNLGHNVEDVARKNRGYDILCKSTTGVSRVEVKGIICASFRAIIATPTKIQFADALPETRSGKIMRRILKKIAAGTVDDIGDTSILAYPAVVEALVKERL